MGNVLGNLVMVGAFFLVALLVYGIGLIGLMLVGAFLLLGGIPIWLIWNSQMASWAKVGWTLGVLMLIAAIL